MDTVGWIVAVALIAILSLLVIVLVLARQLRAANARVQIFMADAHSASALNRDYAARLDVLEPGVEHFAVAEHRLKSLTDAHR